MGGETTYEIHVVNQGSKAAGNVRLAVLLPPEMKAVAAEGPTRHVIDGDRVVFDGLAQLAPKADATYRVRVQGLQPGDLRVRCQLLTDDMQTPGHQGREHAGLRGRVAGGKGLPLRPRPQRPRSRHPRLPSTPPSGYTAHTTMIGESLGPPGAIRLKTGRGNVSWPCSPHTPCAESGTRSVPAT